ncbi:MAG: hypothetical protein COA43_10100 [Robiginitomaculum sp.]|nr:MAG: hypothetical protein COA43_10100 [Robiginitomaculum sp.]
MLNLLFSPQGRVNPQEFMHGAIVLIVLAAAVSLLELVNSSLALILGFASMVTYWCWIVLWIKRFHDTGKSGWMSLVPILIWSILISIGFFMVLINVMAGVAADVGDGQDFMALMESMSEMGPEGIKKTVIPLTLVGVVVSGFVAFVGNKMITHDPEENQFGFGDDVGSTFD